MLLLGNQEDCGDGNTYVVEKQTKYDTRFSDYQKITDSPKFIGGKEKLEKLINEKLELSNEAKKIVFRLNYKFTITCEGKIEDIEVLGDLRAREMTNIKDIILSTDGQWEPAKKDGKKVSCIYFSKKTIVGSKY